MGEVIGECIGKQRVLYSFGYFLGRMSSLEIMALVFSLLILVKIIGLFILSPQRWMRMVVSIYRNKRLVLGVLVVFTVVVGYFILTTLSIITVMAALLFASLLLALGLIPYSSAFLTAAKKVLATRADLLKNFWLVLLIWLGLAVWVLVVLWG